MTYTEENSHIPTRTDDFVDGVANMEANTELPVDGTTETAISPGDNIAPVTANDVFPDQSRIPTADSQRSCRTGYCRNMAFFVFCLAIMFLVRGALLQYTEDILTHIGRRYPITAPELQFIIGAERIGFVAALLFVAFFGNRMHKPWVIGIGLLISAVGSILMAVPFFKSGPRLFDTHISNFAVAGLCKQSHHNVSFQTQCDLIAFKEDDGRSAFTTIVMAKLLIGIGGALYASLGLVYIEEGAKPHRLPLYFGMVICMHGYGRFLGNLLAAWFTSLPEAINAAGSQRLLQTFAVYDQERVGRWWLGYPIFASFFSCLFVMVLWFPRYIMVPDWILRRRIKRARLQVELERRIKLKELAKKKNESNGHRKRKPRTRTNKSDDSKKTKDKKLMSGNEQEEGNDHNGIGNGVVNWLDMTVDEAIVTCALDKNEDQIVGIGQRDERYDGNSTDAPSDMKNNLSDTTSMEVNLETIDEEDRQADFSSTEQKRKHRGTAKTKSVGKTPEELDTVSVDDTYSNEKSKSSKDNNNGKLKRTSKNGTSESASGNKKYRQHNSVANAKSPVAQQTRKVRFRKETLSDLPQTIWRLLHNLRALITMLAAVLAGFYFNGYLATLPEYMRVQFQRSWGVSLILAGVTGPLAWGMGTQLGGLLMFRFRSVPLVRVTLGVILCILACWLLTLVGMAFHCEHDTSPNVTSTAYCAKKCECDSYKVQFEPLCGSDGKTYPSPCHAGCTAIERSLNTGVFNFTGCQCVGGGFALQGACVPECNQVVGFVIVTFIAVFTLSVGIVPVLILLFRSVRSRSKSFTVGFAIWIVYTLSHTLGPVAFIYPLNDRCRHWSKDCLVQNVCWGYDVLTYRLVVTGIAATFLVGSDLTLLLVYWHLRRSRSRRLKRESETQESNVGSVDQESTTTVNEPADSTSINTDGATIAQLHTSDSEGATSDAPVSDPDHITIEKVNSINL